MTGKKRLLYGIFVLIEVGIYAAFVIPDAMGTGNTALIKYVGIVLCFAFSLFAHTTLRQKFTLFALLFTVGADFFLVILGNPREMGVLLFIVVQLFHYLRIHVGNGNRIPLLIVRGIITLCCVALVFILKIVSPVNILTAVYFPQLVMNLIDSIIKNDRTVGSILLSVGLLLFIGCDVCVGLSNLIYSPAASFLIWVFYLPSQVLICLSAALDKGVSNEKK